ncbi:MAG: MBL fold metallo-hydrolase [Nanoarchaeota archaeon]|nr:MBL fold metallo-hydrolase [Nanoarchaeota archaeon]
MKVEKLEGTCLSYYLPDVKLLIDAGAYTDKPVKTLILTHCHCDHFTYAAKIIEEQNPKVFVGRKDVKALVEMGEKIVPEFAVNLTPIIAEGLKEGDVVEGLRVFETPGHTEGSVCLLKNGFLFSGDTLFDKGVGRWDLPSGDYVKLMESLERLKSIPYKFLMPGH